MVPFKFNCTETEIKKLKTDYIYLLNPFRGGRISHSGYFDFVSTLLLIKWCDKSALEVCQYQLPLEWLCTCPSHN